MGRSPCCVKEGLNKGAWTAMEDRRLVDYVMRNGEGKWRNLPKEAGLKRCGKSCRLRWLNYLRPDIRRGNISPDEEDLIIRLHRLLGNRWSLIAGRIPGRTDNEIKNYWNTYLSKKLGSNNKNYSKKQQQEHKKNFTQSPSEENKEISSTQTDHKLSSSTSNYMMINKKCTGSNAELEKKHISWTLDNNEGEFDMDFNLGELMNFTGSIGNDDENINVGACSSSNADDRHNNESNDFSTLFDTDHWLLADVDNAWSCLNGVNWDY